VKPWLILLMHRTLWPADPSSVRGKLELKAAASKAADEREGQLKRRRDVVIEQVVFEFKRVCRKAADAGLQGTGALHSRTLPALWE